EIRTRTHLLAKPIPRQPASDSRVKRSELRQIEPAVRIVEHPGIAEVGERYCRLQAVGLWGGTESRGATCARECVARGNGLVNPVIVRLRRRARDELALAEIFPCGCIARVARLANPGSAPDVRRRRRAAARWRARDRRAPAEAVINKGRLLARLRRIGDPDE